MMQWSSMGLRARLLLLVLFAVIPAFGLIGYTALDQRERATEDAKKDAMNLVRLVTREQRRLIEDTRRLLADLSQQPQVREWGRAAACSRHLAGLRRSYPYYTNLGVAAPGGDISCSAVPLPGPVNIGDRSYFERTVQSGDFSIGDYQVGRVTGVAAINLGYPVLDSGGNLQGVVYAALNLNWLKELITGIELPAGSMIAVMDSLGMILASYPEDGMPGGSEEPSSLASAVLARQRAGTAELAGPDGATRLYAFAPLQANATGNVYVTVGIPTEVAFAGVRGDFVRNVALLLLVSVLVLAAAWAGSEVFVLRRVNALIAATRRLAKGDLSARSGLDGPEELGQLGRALDGMATALQRTNRALKTLSAGNRALVRAADEQQLLAAICRAVVEVGGYRFAWIGYAEDDEHRTVNPVMQYGFDGGLSALSAVIGRITWADTERGRGPVGTAIRTGQPYVARNIPEDPNLAPWREEAMRRGDASAVAFPLLIEGKAVGALAIYSREPDAFDTEELELLGESAEDLAFGIAVSRTRRETEEAHATIKRLAYYDSLTGLPNHAHFLQHVQNALLPAGAGGQRLALFVIGLNRLRDVNNALGFYQGDLLIKEVQVRIRDALPQGAFLARMRGDEFGVLLQVDGAEHAVRSLEGLLDALWTPLSVNGLTLDVSAAAGISLFPEHGTDPVQLLRHADVALHQAKKSGRDYVFYQAGYDEENTRRLELAGKLRRAIESGELVLHYQPKIDMRANCVCGVEALVRWIHPTRGMIPPDEFIALAEDTALIGPLTEWVIQAALAQSSAWRRSGLVVPIAVNLSARSLLNADLPGTLEQLLERRGAEGGWLELEITEGAVMEDPETALRILTDLSDMGMTLYIDDFGTGYSSLGYLKKLPVDAVKIDKSFVIDMLADADSAAIVRSTIGLAHDLGLKVVAEGVENEALRERLTALGCDAAQGYHFSKPLPADEFESWLRHYLPEAAAGRRREGCRR